MNIRSYPYPSLRLESKPLKKVDAKVKEWVAEMFKLMHENDGAGLAACQVGLPYRMFVMTHNDENYVYINPVITNYIGGSVSEQEGCLSLPGVFGSVRRSRRIIVQAYDLEGNEINKTLSGVHARIFQHELDHLDGVMFVERMLDRDLAKIDDEIKQFIVEWDRCVKSGEVDESAILEDIENMETERC